MLHDFFWRYIFGPIFIILLIFWLFPGLERVFFDVIEMLGNIVRSSKQNKKVNKAVIRDAGTVEATRNPIWEEDESVDVSEVITDSVAVNQSVSMSDITVTVKEVAISSEFTIVNLQIANAGDYDATIWHDTYIRQGTTQFDESDNYLRDDSIRDTTHCGITNNGPLFFEPLPTLMEDFEIIIELWREGGHVDGNDAHCTYKFKIDVNSN
jgi:hypothetical protein